MVISYIWGQKVYRVPYAWKKLVAYMVIVALIYLVHHTLTVHIWSNRAFSLVLGTILIGAYALFVLRVERKEFQRLPYIGKYLGRSAAA
jgi:uncharacterized membrane protein YjjB (DUF3815 family)